MLVYQTDTTFVVMVAGAAKTMSGAHLIDVPCLREKYISWIINSWFLFDTGKTNYFRIDESARNFGFEKKFLFKVIKCGYECSRKFGILLGEENETNTTKK